ncbi:ABC transporter ATP-binding protein [Clostridia bacterium]|nr:ABC transporter ATP-binding protein [Clostridia bacterium]
MITIQNLSKSYAFGEQACLPVLTSVSLRIRRGEFVALIGESGSGKSTLLNIIGCLDRPTSGEYVLDGENVEALSRSRLSRTRNRKIGFIFQGFNLIPSLTARENIELPLIYRNVERKLRGELSAEALAAVGLSERAAHLPGQLSGGQQQRVAVARAIAASPPLILADEPCGNLDRRNGGEVMEILHRLNERGKTVVLVTHDEDAAREAGRIVRISGGRVCAA